MHCLPWSDFESFSEHLGPCITPAPPPSSQLAPGLPQGHSSSMGAEGLRAELPKKTGLLFVMFPGRGSFASPLAQGCSQPRAGLAIAAIATMSRYTATLLDFSPVKGLPIIFFLIERNKRG